MRLKAIVCTAVVFTVILLTSLTTVIINNRLYDKTIVNNIYNQCSCATDTTQSSDIDSNDTVSSEVTTQSMTASIPQESKPAATAPLTETTRPNTTTATDQTTIRTEREVENISSDTQPQESQEMREVNINTASADEISECLLIDIELADEIVSLREQIGYFSSVDELFLIDGLESGTISRIAGCVVL